MNIEIRNLHGKDYKVVQDGNDLPIAYNIQTPDDMVRLLEAHRRTKTRMRFHWGDIQTGKDWGEEHDIKGHIGLSRGSEARYPILVYNARSMGGGAILTHCIVKITRSKGNALIYQHPNYN